jgi:hypothetical protein
MDWIPMMRSYRLPPGRIIVVMLAMRPLAEKYNAPGLLSVIDLCLSLAQQAFDLSRRLSTQRRQAAEANDGERLRSFDLSFDRIASALDGLLDSLSISFAEEELGQTAKRVRQTLFPNGLGALTKSNYADECAEGQRMVGLFHGELAGELAKLPLGSLPARFEAVVTDFTAALTSRAEQLSGTDVSVAIAKAQRAYLRVIASIIASYGGDSEDHARACAELFAPVQTQNEAMREAYRRQRPQSDLDPSSGVELENPLPPVEDAL